METQGIIACPQCGEKMALRSGKFGKFYGCTAYPKCKGTKPFGPFVKKEDRQELKIIKARWDGRAMVMAFLFDNQEIGRWKYNKDGSVEKTGESITGTVVSTHPGGALKAEINFIDNQMSGNYEEFDVNGNMTEKGIYRNGKKEVHFKAGQDPASVDAPSSPDSVYLDEPAEEAPLPLNEDPPVPDNEEEDLPF